jgi:hypothetical protein
MLLAIIHLKKIIYEPRKLNIVKLVKFSNTLPSVLIPLTRLIKKLCSNICVISIATIKSFLTAYTILLLMECLD